MPDSTELCRVTSIETRPENEDNPFSILILRKWCLCTYQKVRTDSLNNKIMENCKKIENQFEKQIEAQEIISNILPSKEEGDFQEIFDNLSVDRKQFYQVFIDKAKEIWDEKSGNKKAGSNLQFMQK